MSRMQEIRTKSPIPVYGMAAVWIIYCLFFPLYTLLHFAVLVVVSAVVFIILSRIFPGKTEYVEIPDEPVSTGNAETDKILSDGSVAISELDRLHNSISNPEVKEKISVLSGLIDKISKDALEDPDDIPQIKRFMNYFLPTTLKLLNAYDRMAEQDIDGENIGGTMQKIEDILDTTIDAYKKFLDSLFANQALDIETDIMVLESMLAREGLGDKDFKSTNQDH